MELWILRSSRAELARLAMVNRTTARNLGLHSSIMYKMPCLQNKISCTQRWRITIEICHTLSTIASKRLTTTKNALLRPTMHFYKLILAAVGISFAAASPTPQSIGDLLEACEANCLSQYNTCDSRAVNTAEQSLWYVTQQILKLGVPLLTAHSLATWTPQIAKQIAKQNMAWATLETRLEEPPNRPWIMGAITRSTLECIWTRRCLYWN